MRGETKSALDRGCRSATSSSRRGRGKVTTPSGNIPAARFIGPDQRDEGEVGGPEENDTHSTNALGRQEEPQRTDTEKGDEILEAVSSQ